MTGIQQSFSTQKQKNKSHIPECGNETPSGEISILGKQNSPLGLLPQTRWVYPPKKSGTQGEVAGEEDEEKEAWPPGKMEERVL